MLSLWAKLESSFWEMIDWNLCPRVDLDAVPPPNKRTPHIRHRETVPATAMRLGWIRPILQRRKIPAGSAKYPLRVYVNSRQVAKTTWHNNAVRRPTRALPDNKMRIAMIAAYAGSRELRL